MSKKGKNNTNAPVTGASSLQAQATVANVTRGDSSQIVNAQDIIARISTASVLVSVKAHLWRGTKSAKHLKAALVRETQGEDEGFNSPILVVIPPEMRSQLTAKVTEAMNFFKRHSIPYGENRMRLVPQNILPDVQRILGELDVELRRLGDDVALRRDEVVKWAKQKLGNAYEEDTVPSQEELKNKCHLQVDYSAIGTPPTMDCEGAEEIRKQIEESMCKQYNEGLKTVISEVNEQLKATVESLQKENQKNIRYGSLVQSFMRSVKRLKKLNIGDAPEVTALIDKSVKAMQKLVDADADNSLKASDKGKTAREEVQKEVEAASHTLDSFTL